MRLDMSSVDGLRKVIESLKDCWSTKHIGWLLNMMKCIKWRQKLFAERREDRYLRSNVFAYSNERL